MTSVRRSERYERLHRNATTPRAWDLVWDYYVVLGRLGVGDAFGILLRDLETQGDLTVTRTKLAALARWLRSVRREDGRSTP